MNELGCNCPTIGTSTSWYAGYRARHSESRSSIDTEVPLYSAHFSSDVGAASEAGILPELRIANMPVQDDQIDLHEEELRREAQMAEENRKKRGGGSVGDEEDDSSLLPAWLRNTLQNEQPSSKKARADSDKILLVKPAVFRFLFGLGDVLFFLTLGAVVTLARLLRNQNQLLKMKCARDEVGQTAFLTTKTTRMWGSSSSNSAVSIGALIWGLLCALGRAFLHGEEDGEWIRGWRKQRRRDAVLVNSTSADTKVLVEADKDDRYRSTFLHFDGRSFKLGGSAPRPSFFTIVHDGVS